MPYRYKCIIRHLSALCKTFNALFCTSAFCTISGGAF
nr:MAG TPA: hypothetical protein [Caudoviricetes sp.]